MWNLLWRPHILCSGRNLQVYITLVGQFLRINTENWFLCFCCKNNSVFYPHKNGILRKLEVVIVLIVWVISHYIIRTMVNNLNRSIQNVCTLPVCDNSIFCADILYILSAYMLKMRFIHAVAFLLLKQQVSHIGIPDDRSNIWSKYHF